MIWQKVLNTLSDFSYSRDGRAYGERTRFAYLMNHEDFHRLKHELRQFERGYGSADHCPFADYYALKMMGIKIYIDPELPDLEPLPVILFYAESG